MTDATLGASDLWLGTRTGASGTATLTKSFFWPHGQQVEGRIFLKLHKANPLYLDILYRNISQIKITKLTIMFKYKGKQIKEGVGKVIHLR